MVDIKAANYARYSKLMAQSLGFRRGLVNLLRSTALTGSWVVTVLTTALPMTLDPLFSSQPCSGFLYWTARLNGHLTA